MTDLVPTAAVLRAAPQTLTVELDLVAAAIDAASACATVCTACASACLSEDEDMAGCVRDALDAAEICTATARVLARLNRSDKAVATSLLAACIEACVQCAGSCGPHREHREHCALCERACRACEAACQALLDALRDV